MVHRARELAMANRTAQVNQIRRLLAEFGIVVPKGVARLHSELPGILEDAENGLPMIGRQALASPTAARTLLAALVPDLIMTRHGYGPP
jgi:transposase